MLYFSHLQSPRWKDHLVRTQWRERLLKGVTHLGVFFLYFCFFLVRLGLRKTRTRTAVPQYLLAWDPPPPPPRRRWRPDSYHGMLQR